MGKKSSFMGDFWGKATLAGDVDPKDPWLTGKNTWRVNRKDPWRVGRNPWRNKRR